jgi:Mg-chelatase subunit ChlD
MKVINKNKVLPHQYSSRNKVFIASKFFCILSSIFMFSIMNGCGQEDQQVQPDTSEYADSEYDTSTSGGHEGSLGEEYADSAGTGDVSDVSDEYDPSTETNNTLGTSRTLTAGLWDDNLYPNHYQSFAEESAIPALSDLPTHRQIIQVVNQEGAPIRGAELLITTGQASTSLKSIDDGRALFAPSLDGNNNLVEVTARLGTLTVKEQFELNTEEDNPWVLTLADAMSTPATTLEVALVIDATGSMGDEINFLKAEFAELIRQIQRNHPMINIRLALTHYRDKGDDYVTRSLDFTSDLDHFQAELDEVFADGGGDFPEAMGEAMEEVMELNWSQEVNATRLVFIAADAPPQEGRQARVDRAALTARANGVRIFPIASSGVDTSAEWVMRQAAAFTLGQYIFLTDDSGVGGGHAEPHIPCYQVRLLQDQLLRVIESGIEGRWVEGDADEIIRSVGFNDLGECVGMTANQSVLEDEEW